MIMKQKYIMPKAELIEVKANAILAGSNLISNDVVNVGEPTMGSGNGTAARSPLATDIWEDIDETNGYK